MTELASQVGAELLVRNSAGEKKVSASFNGLTLENALKTLLKGENYAVVYSGDIHPSERSEYLSVENIYVFFSGSGRFNSEPESGHRAPEITGPRYRPDFQQANSLPDAVMSDLAAAAAEPSMITKPERNDRTRRIKDLAAEQKEARLPVSAVKSMAWDTKLGAASEDFQPTHRSDGLPDEVLTDLINRTLRDRNPEALMDAVKRLKKRRNKSGRVR